MVNPPTQRYAAAWRHPDSGKEWLRASSYVDIARLLEDGGFDLMFMPDALAVPEDAQGDVATTLASGGKGAVTLDPITVLSAVVGATSRIGLGATVSTSFLPPYAIARTLASLDHLSAGRVAWNIVTSTTDAEARNMGQASIAPKAMRYDRADRVVTQVLELMGTWHADALVQEAESGLFADPRLVARTPAPRERSAAPGPLSLPRSPQGHPVLMQAGASPRGMEFAAKWAELVFIAADGIEGNLAVRTELRERAPCRAQPGRAQGVRGDSAHRWIDEHRCSQSAGLTPRAHRRGLRRALTRPAHARGPGQHPAPRPCRRLPRRPSGRNRQRRIRGHARRGVSTRGTDGA